MTPLTWLEELFEHADPNKHITLFGLDYSDHEHPQRTAWGQPDNLPQLADTVTKLNKHGDVWVGVGLRNKRTKGRGTADNITEFPGLWLDIDIGAEDHQTHEALPETLDQALALVANGYPIDPTHILWTGHGLHYWWLFDEPLELTDHHLDSWAATWAAIAHEAGLHIDNVFDRPRVMRLPGTVNRKPDKEPTDVEHVGGTGQRHDLEDLERLFRDPPPKPEWAGKLLPVGERPTDNQGRPGDEFNEQIPCEQILEQNGWTYGHTDRVGTHWVRPGKTRGTGGTVYLDGFFNCHSTNADPLTKDRRYDAYGLYTVFQHQGDHQAAAKALVDEGYGSSAKMAEELAMFAQSRHKGGLVGDAAESDQTTADDATKPTKAKKGKKGQSRKKKTKSAKANKQTKTVKKNTAETVTGPQPLWSQQRTAPPLPWHDLPQLLTAISLHLGDVFQTPPELPFTAALAAVSAAANESSQRVRIRKGYTEPGNLYLVAVAEPSLAKTPVIKQAKKWLKPTRDALRAQTALDAKEHAIDEEILQKRLKELKDQIAKDEAKEVDRNGRDGYKAADKRAAMRGVLEQLAELGESFPRQMLVDDVTPEAFADLMYRNQGRLSVLTAEGDVILKSTGRYTDQKHLGHLLAAWSGDEMLINRKQNNNEEVSIPDPTSAIGIMVQPSVIDALYGDAEAVGSGLASRFMLAHPTSNRGYRSYQDAPPIDERLMDEMTAACTHIAAMSPRVWKLDPGAQTMLLGWMDELEMHLRPGGRYDPQSSSDIIGQYVGKVKPSVARAALLFHLLDPERPKRIQPATVAHAIALGEFWLDQALFARDWMSPPDVVVHAQKMLHWARRTGRQKFKAMDFQRNNVGANRTKAGGKAERPEIALVRAALDLLTSHGWLIDAATGHQTDHQIGDMEGDDNATHYLAPQVASDLSVIDKLITDKTSPQASKTPEVAVLGSEDSRVRAFPKYAFLSSSSSSQKTVDLHKPRERANGQKTYNHRPRPKKPKKRDLQ